MKILSTALLLLLFVLSLSAQPDTTKNFYPLQVGNVWQYRVEDPSGSTYIGTGTIIRDTLMPNGKKYYVFQDGFVLRIDDSLNTYRYGYPERSGESLVDKLGAKPSETWISSRGPSIGEAMMLGYRREVIFGDTVETRRILYQRADERLIDFADKFGPFYVVVELGIRSFLIGAIINGKRYGNLVSVPEREEQLPSDFVVKGSFPNPFNSTVNIEYHLPQTGEVEVEVYSTLGMKIRTLVVLQKQQAGKHIIRWDGKNEFGGAVGSGVYLIRVKWNGQLKTVRSVYLK